MVGAIILIVVGLMFLLSNLGVLHWDFWESVWRLWPVVLIGIGLDMMAKRSRLRSVLFGGFWAIVAILFLLLAARAPEGSVERQVVQPLQGAKEARVELDVDAGSLDLVSGTAEGVLLAGRFRGSDRTEIEQSYEVRDGTGVLKLREHRRWRWLRLFSRRSTEWQLALSKEVPLRLYVDTGVGDARLHLEDLRLVRLDVDCGVGDTELALPARGKYKAMIDAGVGEVVVRLPEGLAASISVDSGIGSVSVSGPYLKRGGRWESENFEQASDRVELTISAGVGSVEVVAEKRPAGAADSPATPPEDAAATPKAEKGGKETPSAPAKQAESKESEQTAPSRGK